MSFASRKKKSKVRGFPQTDAGNAELLAALYRDVLKYDHRQGRWLIWDEGWTEDNAGKVCIFAIKAARRRREMGASIADKEKSKREIRWAFQSEHRHRLDAALEIARSLPPLSDPGGGWDADPWLLGVANGIVDLRTGKLREERPEDRIIKHSPVQFEADAKCPRFEQFLSEILGGDAGLIRYVQKAFGYSLTGRTGEQNVFCGHGPGANGKTTLFGVFHHVFGDYAVNLPFSALEMRNRNSNDLVALAGCRFATAAETNEGVRLNEARIKTLTGGDPVTARRLYHEAFTFEPTHKLWLAFNHKPIIADASEGMWRRIHLIPFTRQFRPEEQDKNLPDTLKAEASGILAWAVEGCSLWQKDGLGMPPAVVQATAAYREESDHLGQFIDECCSLDRNASAPVTGLWQAYQQWADENEEVSLCRQVFTQRMEKKGFLKGRSGHERTRIWVGIGLPDGGGADTRTSADAVSNNSPVGEGV